MFTKTFVKAALERAVKTVAQALIAVFAASQANILTADWKAVLATAGTAGLLSILTSIASDGFGPKGTPSLVADQPVPVRFEG